MMLENVFELTCRKMNVEINNRTTVIAKEKKLQRRGQMYWRIIQRPKIFLVHNTKKIP